MAVFDLLLQPGQAPVTKQTIATATAGAAISIGNYKAIAISSTGDVHVAFGGSGVTAGAGDFLIPGSQLTVYDLGGSFTHVRFFNDSGASVDVYVQVLSKS